MDAEKQTCRRRISEFGPWEHGENLDSWRVEPNGDRTCSFCGSMHPDDFLAFMKAIPSLPGARVERTDKRYKFYIHRPEIKNAMEGAIKFYTQHIPDEAAEAALNEAYAAIASLCGQRFEEGIAAARARWPTIVAATQS